MSVDIAASIGADLREAIGGEGYAFVRADIMRDALVRAGSLSDWNEFAASWNNLGVDTYLADSGRYRRRRYAVYGVTIEGAVTLKSHQPHYQSVAHNFLYGGIERWFDPIAPEFALGPSMRTILEFCREIFAGLAERVPAWHVEVHQFRIEARPGAKGHPTPEGMHRDGVDYVLVLLVRRHDIVAGTTMISTQDGSPCQSFTLTNPLDAAFVDDNRVFHGVTPVEPLGESALGFRDVLVVTFRKEKE